jgi:hypothetical protein
VSVTWAPFSSWKTKLWVSQAALSGFARPPPSAIQSFHRRSMLAWCSQKIGSSAAQFTAPIQPAWHAPIAPPPTMPWTMLCGVLSSAPDALPNWIGALGPPPKLGVGGVAENAVRDIAVAADVAVAGSCPPAIIAALRRGAPTNSGLTLPSGSVAARNAGGSVLRGNAWS